MPQYELRAMVRWMDEKGEHVQVVVRDTKSWLYRSFKVDPKRPVLKRVAECLKVKEKDIVIPSHLKGGMLNK
ncbi:MAG: hypothetical protein JRD89_10870 [Deltaproteobacteria bacterium]|nr:hypothetical protein [Deltaproteobacteria bacterium]